VGFVWSLKKSYRIPKQDVQTLPGADIDSDHNLLVAKICTRLKKIITFQKRRPQWDLEKMYTQKRTVQDTLEGKLGAIECDSGYVEVRHYVAPRWKKYLSYTSASTLGLDGLL
jgi:hypothetical protein